MNFTVYVQDELGQKLDFLAKTEQKSRNTLIREALELYLSRKNLQQWPVAVLNFPGTKQPLTAFEALREELQPIPNPKI